MNVYQMYVENGNAVGFWVQRQTWGYTVACVLSIGDQVAGHLIGVPPYYGNPEVLAEFWKIDVDGARVERLDVDVLRGPGNYTYRRIDPPLLRAPGSTAESGVTAIPPFRGG